MFSFKVISFRRIPLFPHDVAREYKQVGNEIRRYIAIADIRQLPLGFPTETNPRDVKLSTTVGRDIVKALKDNDYFHLLNRGILISAKSVKHDDKDSALSIDFGDQTIENDRSSYGVVDGGHTYAAIKGVLGSDELADDANRYVCLDIYTGIGDKDTDVSIVDFAYARNNSVSVDEKSLAELEEKFDYLKAAVSGKPYADKIAYKQNSQNPVDIREIISLMTVFDCQSFNPVDPDSQPIVAYSQKESCLNRFIDEINPKNQLPYASRYKALKPILCQLLELSDYVKSKIPEIWNSGTEQKGRIGTKLKKRKGVTYHFKPDLSNPNEEQFDAESKGRPLWLPVLAALRVLVSYNDRGKAYFVTDPEEFFDELAPKLVSLIREASTKYPMNALGKDKALWQNLVQTALLFALGKGIVTFDGLEKTKKSILLKTASAA